MPHVDLICLDADDTLWHNMRFFDVAERAIVAMLAPFADAGAAREAMAAAEIRNLSLYGYGAKSFTLSMIETALEFGADAATIRAILHAGRELLAHPVELFDGIADTLAALADRAPLVLVTKGDLFHQEAKLAASGLGAHFHGIEIVSEAVKLRDRLSNIDLCITGEGRFDRTSLAGKTTSGVARLCNEFNIPCIVLAGSVQTDLDLTHTGITSALSICNEPMPLETCIANAKPLLNSAAERALKLFQSRQ